MNTAQKLFASFALASSFAPPVDGTSLRGFTSIAENIGREFRHSGVSEGSSRLVFYALPLAADAGFRAGMVILPSTRLGMRR
jgi:hypothetical protein